MLTSKASIGRFARSATRVLDDFLAGCVVIMMLAIVVQVFCSTFDLNPVAVFDRAYFVVGSAITLNTLLDFQWHLLVAIGLLPAGFVWLRDRHVRVDFLYSSFSEKTKGRVDLCGNLVFGAPFLVMIIPATWDFAGRAFRSGERGTNGGLADLWVVKGILFVGFCLLALAVLVESYKLVRR